MARAEMNRIPALLAKASTATVTAARGWPKLTALLLGAASATGFAPLGLWPVTLLAFALLLILLVDAPTQRRTFAIGWAFGVGHFALGLNWIATAFTYQAAMPTWLGWVAVLLLSLYLAIYPALAAWGAWASADRLRLLGPQPAAGSIAPLMVAFAAFWIITEWLRSWAFTGFAWNPLAATMVSPDFDGWLPFLGTYGVSAMVILMAAGIAMVAVGERRNGIALGAVALFGWVTSVNLAPAPPLGETAITIVQPNVGQQDKWQGEKADANFEKLARLTRPLSGEPRLILWPEAAIPDYLEAGYPWVYYDRSPAETRARLTALMNPGDRMLLGALKLELDKTGEVVGARNAVMLVRPDGSLGPRYDKSHLVPYGEYLPMRPILSAIGLSRLTPGDLDFWPGPGPRSIDTGSFGLAGIQICYEIIFSGQVVDRANRPQFIFNPSNDAWFGSWGPPQHLAQARLRAIEEGLPVIRSTPTGISAIIDADGRIVDSLPMGVAGRIEGRLPAPHAPTLFARFGNILGLIFAGLLFALAIASARLRR